MLRIPNVGDTVCLLIPTVSANADDVETTTPGGTTFVVERMLPGRQGLQFQLASACHGVCIFVAETDLVDNCFPFEMVVSR